MEIVIASDGTVRCLYGELIPLAPLGEVQVRRGSHVEPDIHGQWWCDLAPVHGPQLGPFEIRSEALAAEVAWLQAHWLLPDH